MSTLAELRWLVLLAACLGMAAGWAHASTHLWVRYVKRSLTWETVDVPWMSPVANALLLAAAAVILWALRWWVPRIPRRAADAVLVFLAVFAVMLLAPTVHPLASAVVAGGVAWALSGAIQTKRERWTRLTTASGFGLLVLTCGAFAVARAIVADRPASAAPATEDQPNVLLLILDTVRAASTSLYGYERETTPAIGRIAAEGTRFEFAMSSAPWTLPSHASIFTGQYPGQLNSSWRQPLTRADLTLAEMMQRAGYATGGFVANNWYTSRESGLARGFDTYRDFSVATAQILFTSTLFRAPLVGRLLDARRPGDLLRAFRLPRYFQNEPTPPYPRKSARKVADEFLTWQATLHDRPFFAFLNFYDAHDPYRPPEGFRGRFAGGGAEALDRYEEAIAALDHEVGRLVDSLRTLGILDKTLVIVASDHGELFGERGLFGHGNSVYTNVLRVPLVLRLPGAIPARKTVGDVVSLRDLGATIADYAHVTSTGFPGTSLRAAIDGHPDDVSPAAAEFEGRGARVHNGRKGVRTALFGDSLELVVRDDGGTELYRFRVDPDDSDDVSDDPGYSALLAAFAAAHDSVVTLLRAIPDASRR